MKCKNCDGTGIVPYRDGNGNIVKEMGLFECPFCNKGEIKVTNEQWLRLCTTEQLAGFLADKCNEVVETVLSDASCDIGDIDNDDYWYRRADFVEWLKQPHNSPK